MMSNVLDGLLEGFKHTGAAAFECVFSCSIGYFRVVKFVLFRFRREVYDWHKEKMKEMQSKIDELKAVRDGDAGILKRLKASEARVEELTAQVAKEKAAYKKLQESLAELSTRPVDTLT